MSVLEKLPISSVVTFDTLAPDIIGTDFVDVRVLAHIDVDTARLFIDPVQMHQSVYPYLDRGAVPNDPEQYLYVKVRLANGQTTVLGAPWINESSIVSENRMTLTITVDKVGAEDRERIIRALSSNGYKTANVTLS